MKTGIKNLFTRLGGASCAAWVVLALLPVTTGLRAHATTMFPIATNANLVELCVGGAFDGTNYLVVLESGPNLSAQLVSSNFTLIGSQITVGNNPVFPPGGTVGFGRTNYLVVWSDSSISSGVDMFGQFIAQSGGKVRSAFPLLQSVGTHGIQAIQCMAFDGTNFLVGWLDENNSTIYIQFVTQTGSLLGFEIATTPGPSIPAKEARMALDGTNYLGVVQLKTSSSPEQWSTYGRFFSRNGSLGTSFLISQTTSASENPCSIAFDGTNYLVVWNRDIGPGYPSVPIWNLYGRLVSRAGTFPGNELVLVTNQALLPSLAFDGSHYLLGWSYNFDTTNSNKTLRYRFLDRTASLIGSEFTLFAPQGTNSPLFGGLVYGSNRFLAVASLGVVAVDSSGGLTGILSGDSYGAFIPASTAPPQFGSGASYGNKQFTLSLAGTPGINYAIQMATNLVASSWTSLVTNSPTNGTFTFTDTGATNRSRFYRAVKQ
jgi:hypothetical protein